MLEIFSAMWSECRRAWDVLRAVRFSLIVVLGAGLAYVSNDQFQDLLAGFAPPNDASPAQLAGSGLRMVVFVAAVTWWALQGWGWARYVLGIVYPSNAQGERARQGLERVLVDYLPRLIAIAAYALTALAAFRSKAPHFLVIALIVTGILVFCFLVVRRRLADGRFGGLAERPTWQLMGVTFAVVVASAVWAIASPVTMGTILGAGTVVVLGLGCIVAVGSFAVARTHTQGIPVLTLAIAAAIIFSLWNDNHAIRVLDTPSDRYESIPIADAFEQWQAQLADTPPSRPLVLVATAGGGLRAAYWTGAVLGELEDRIAGFHRSVFAISGVSGGSVGATFYNAALSALGSCTARNNDDRAECLKQPLLGAIGRDYLGPVATSLVYGDLLQRFLPVAILPDRATALENAFEHGFQQQFPMSECGLDIAFRRFWHDPTCRRDLRWMPILLINGTHQETGRRVLTTPLDVTPAVFADTDDFHRRHGMRPIPASTAAHNSARFTFVSPAGTFEDSDGHQGHLIDGGYFENYGATTLEHVVEWLQHHRQGTQNARRLVVIVVSNDIHLTRADFAATEPRKSPPIHFVNEVQAPIIGMLRTRGARGLLAVKQLESATRAMCGRQSNTSELKCPQPEFVHFMIEKRAEDNPPLGWVLSPGSKLNLQRQVSEGSNCRELARVLRAFDKAPLDCD